ncbi:MAG: acetolactate synthase large subunit, partial [Sinobacteraceae bacterium]|nr:acetolactate synthase large subunit [Nevskiaceae bacterium]
FARITGRPAMTLLHLGPGYLNGAANLHNARRAFSPIMNIVGDHATYHRGFDAPLTSDIEALVKPLARWTGRVASPREAGSQAATAYAESCGPPGGNAFLLLPADSAWLDGASVAPPKEGARSAAPSRIEAVAKAIRAAERPALLINGTALGQAGLAQAARLNGAGIRILADTFATRQRRGKEYFAPTRLPYFAEQALAALEGVDLLVTVGTRDPVAFFAYPGKPSELTPEGTTRLTVGGPEIDSAAALRLLADAIGAPAPSQPITTPHPTEPRGELTLDAIACSLTRHMPTDCIISDDSVTAGMTVFGQTMGAAAHDWLFHTGGAIGQGLPMAIGAAIGAPERPVIALCGDGAAMYTIQSLWTMAREKLDITVIIFANRMYRILAIELERTRAGKPGKTAQSLLSLRDPVIDWVKVAQAQGVVASRCERAEEFDHELKRVTALPGPKLIEAVLSP